MAPTLALTLAPFNTAFPGTISISPELFAALVREVVAGLTQQGFRRLYFLNAHGANIAPLYEAAGDAPGVAIRSWWDFDKVNDLRRGHFGDWEGMHATPSEIAITQATHRIVPPGDATEPPRRLSTDFIRERAGDRHGPPDEHRREFPDGRVGSHSALATPEIGREMLATAARAVADDYLEFCGGRAPAVD